MLELFAIVLPVFGLIGLGYATASLGLVPAHADETLSDFLFNIDVTAGLEFGF